MSHRFRLARTRAFASLGAVAVAVAVIVAVLGSSGAVAGAQTARPTLDQGLEGARGQRVRRSPRR